MLREVNWLGGGRRAAVSVATLLCVLLFAAAQPFAVFAQDKAPAELTHRIFLPGIARAFDPGATEPSCSPTVSQAPVSSDESAEARIIAAINAARADAGLKPLQVAPRLIQAARSHSRDMAVNNFTGHTGSDGSDFVTRLERVCVRWRMAAENVGWGSPDTYAMMKAWMDSPPHRANILNPDLTEVGVGYASQPGSDYTDYWTIDFTTE